AERRGQRPRDHEHIASIGRPPLGAQRLHAVAQGAAIGQLEHQVRLILGQLADVVDRRHVWAARTAQSASLADEALQHVRVQGVVLREDLHGDLVVEAEVVGAMHGGEGARAEAVGHLVPSDPLHQSIAPRIFSSFARPRLIWAFTVPSGRSRRAAISATGSCSRSRRISGAWYFSGSCATAVRIAAREATIELIRCAGSAASSSVAESRCLRRWSATRRFTIGCTQLETLPTPRYCPIDPMIEMSTSWETSSTACWSRSIDPT